MPNSFASRLTSEVLSFSHFQKLSKYLVRSKVVHLLLTTAFVLAVSASAVNAQVSLTTLGTPYTQNFDTLPASGSATWTNNSNIPGWFHARTGTGTTIVANDGSSNAGNLYSYGTGTATDRALGSLGSGNAAVGNLFWGVRLQNNTGSTITQLDISYTGEQWRNSAAAAQTLAFSYLIGSPTVTGSLAEFQSAGVAVTSLDFTSPITGGTAIALNGNLAANRVTITFSITGLNIPNGTEVMLRWSDPDHTGADHGLSIDDFSVTPQGTVTPGVTLSINDVSQDEGNAGTTAFTFNVTLSSTVHEGVTFDICAADGTAQDDNPATEDNDYTANCLTGQTIANGSDTYQFTVNVNGDLTNESNETFFVNVTNVVGATVADGQGQGTINNDDITLTPIHDIQGNGTSSPLAGQTVTTTGIVTLLRTGSNAGSGTANGFFLQDPNPDADPNTSEGIFVFTSSVPTVAVGDSVRVTGTVVEFNGLTEISPVTNVTVLSTGNTLPAAVTLDSTILSPTALPTKPQLEKYESMRIGNVDLKSVAPNDSFYDVYTVLSSVPRSMREPGIEISLTVPADASSTANVPRWDENPERLKLDTNGRAGAPNNFYTSNVTFTNVTGPLDFAFSEWRLIPDAAPSASSNMSAVALPTPLASEFTVAGFNIENFNNNATQRQKAALGIRTIMNLPDIIGLAEIFDLADLQALRDQINNDTFTATGSNPLYEAYLVEQDGTSEDSDQDVGFLVKTSRVQVNSVTQQGAAETYAEPGGNPAALLHDRPPLVLDANVDPTGTNRRVFVMVNHTRSFIDIDQDPGDGPRVRAKRKAQAESIANMLQTLQTANPTASVISVGDYNAYQFNDGYTDPVSVIKGSPTADDQMVVAQSPDLVNPNFANLIDSVPADSRYSFMFEGTPQALDHVFVNTVALARNTRIHIAHMNSDFPDIPASAFESNAGIPERNSDHDAPVAYFSLSQQQAAGSVIISEFRFRGPGFVGGPPAGAEAQKVGKSGITTPTLIGPTNQSEDEFIEIYNNTDSDITVSTTDGSAGWAVVAADGAIRFIIPNNTVIPARGHFLGVNTDGYSLSSYGGPGAAAGNVVLQADGVTLASGYTQDIPDGSGVALFRSANSGNFTLAERLDAAGYAGVNSLYREGTGFPTGGAETTSNLEHTFFRTMTRATSGRPKDTGDNTADFFLADTAGTDFDPGPGTIQRLGAPGPENLFSPINHTAQFTTALLDSSVSAESVPNRERNLTVVSNGTFGTLTLRRKFTNNTGGALGRLRFRIVEISTFPSPTGSGLADLRALDSSDEVVATSGGPVFVRGSILEQPPFQSLGGGWNATLNVPIVSGPPALDAKVLFDTPTTGTIVLSQPLNNGESINVQFKLGVMQTGRYFFYLNIETSPGCSIVATLPCVLN